MPHTVSFDVVPILPPWAIAAVAAALAALVTHGAVLLVRKKLPGRWVTILALLRLAISGVFVLCLLQPVVSFSRSEERRPDALVLIDTSRSMSRESAARPGVPRLREVLDPLAALALVAIGVLSGILAGLLGVGGGVIMVPAMVVLFGIPPVVAKGTSVAVIVPTAIIGTWRNRTNRNADLRIGALIGVSGVISAILGSQIAERMSAQVSNTLFAALMAVVIARQLNTLRSPDPAATSQTSTPPSRGGRTAPR